MLQQITCYIMTSSRSSISQTREFNHKNCIGLTKKLDPEGVRYWVCQSGQKLSALCLFHNDENDLGTLSRSVALKPIGISAGLGVSCFLFPDSSFLAGPSKGREAVPLRQRLLPSASWYKDPRSPVTRLTDMAETLPPHRIV